MARTHWFGRNKTESKQACNTGTFPRNTDPISSQEPTLSVSTGSVGSGDEIEYRFTHAQ